MEKGPQLAILNKRYVLSTKSDLFQRIQAEIYKTLKILVIQRMRSQTLPLRAKPNLNKKLRISLKKIAPLRMRVILRKRINPSKRPHQKTRVQKKRRIKKKRAAKTNKTQGKSLKLGSKKKKREKARK